MARVTVEDSVKLVGNRFDLVLLATKRARQIATGGKDPMVPRDNDKPTVLALREIEEGLITRDDFAKMEEEERRMRAEAEQAAQQQHAVEDFSIAE